MKRTESRRAPRASRPAQAVRAVLGLALVQTLLLALSLALCLGVATTSAAQETTPGAAPPAQTDESRFSARASLGFTASPDAFLMTLEVPWAVDDLVSVGPLFQLGLSDDDTLFAPTLQVYLNPRLGGDLDEIRPYGHMGMGLIYLKDNDRAGGRDEEDADFLFTMGVGAEYALTQDFFLGTGMLFNVIPTGAVGQKFVFGWQVLTLRAAF